MQGEDALLTVAEFAVAIAGFTSVVVVFGHRGGEWRPVDRFRIANALWQSFGAGFFALLPSALQLLGLEGEGLWRVASALLMTFLLGILTLTSRNIRRLEPDDRAFLGRVVPAAMAGGTFVNTALQLWNASGLGPAPGPGLYFVGLLLLLTAAAVAFVRTIFLRPR